MTRRELVLAGLVVVVAAVSVLCVVAGAASGSDAIGIAGAAAVVVAVGWVVSRLGTGPRGGSGFDASLRGNEPPEVDRPADLAEAERAVQLHVRSGDVHLRLRPMLREIAAERLWTERDLDLDRDDEQVRPLLGDRLYELVRADRAVAGDTWGDSGIGASDVESFLRTLEAL